MEARDAPGGPLAGLRVVEFAGLGAAPYGVMLLADLGAEVLRIDRPGAARHPSHAAHVGLWRGRRSAIVDLHHPEAARVMHRLLQDADVLVEGFRPGTMERRGLGPETVCDRHPTLIYARMTGWGQEGPLSTTAGHDVNYAALSGALSTVGSGDRPPPPVVNYLADFGGGGMLLAVGILSALFERQISGRGQVVDVAMVDGASSLTTFVHGLAALGAWSGDRGENLLDGGAPFYATYRCADGRFVAVGAIEPEFFGELLTGLGLPESLAASQHDRPRWGEIRALLAERFATRPRDDWARRFAGSDACVTPVLELHEVAEHPHHQARSSFAVPLRGPLITDENSRPMPSPAPRFSRTPGQGGAAAPIPGLHTRQLLTEAGFETAEQDELLALGVVAEA